MRQRDMNRLESKIARALGWKLKRSPPGWCEWFDPAFMVWRLLPRFTRDLNAVVAACEEAGLMWQIGRQEGGAYWSFTWRKARSDYWDTEDHSTPALALSLALLAALEARQ